MKTYPLSQSQLGVYLEHIQHPESMKYNSPLRFHFSKGTDAKKLKQAIISVMEAYPIFYTKIIIQDGELRQYPDFSLQIDVPVIHILEEEVEQQIKQFIRPFDFQKDNLFRSLFIETPSSLYFMSDIHHIVMDGSSDPLRILYMGMAYNGQVLPKEQMSLYEYAEQEELSFRTPAYEQAAIYYKEKFEGVEMTKLLQKSNDEGYLTEESVFISKKLIDDFCMQQEIRPSWLFMSAFGITLSKFSRTKTIAYASINHGRYDKRLLDSFGMFVKTVPILMRIDETLSVIDFIKSHKQELASTREQGIYPFTHFCQHLGIKPELTFAFQGPGVKEECLFLDEYIKYDQPLASGLSMEKPCIFIYETNTEYEIRIKYVDCQYDASYIQHFANLMANCIKQLIVSPDKLLKEISIVPEDEQRKLIALGKGEELVYDQTETFIDLFRKQVALYPDSIAVVFQDRQYTYCEIDRLSTLLALHLRNQGVARETVVGVMIDRSEWMVIYPLAIMKAGGAYMPLDYNFPAERLYFMIEKAKVSLILSEEVRVRTVLPEFKGDVIATTDVLALPDTNEELVYRPSPEDMYVILYTSGSTGMPKGCVLEHHNLLNFCYWYIKDFEVTSNDRSLAYANFGFDAHMMDIYPLLMCGGAVYIIPSSMRMDITAVNSYIEDNHITVTFFTTQIGVQVASMFNNKSLRLLSVGGEKLPSINKPSYRFFNGYGPTECTMYSTFYEVQRDNDNEYIGRPLANYQLYVLDSQMNLVPRGVAGELCISGDGVGRGYLNSPEQTKEKFITVAGKRVYRTGDLVRWAENDNIQFLGRIDNQVKLRGFRIELGEIESAISKYKGIQTSVVEVKEIGSVQHLCGYYTSEEAIDEEKLREYLSGTLTDYMVPTIFMRLESLPLTPNGKVNRKALPMPEIEVQEIVAPTTGKEEILFNIVKNLFSREDFGVSTDLIRMGLTSLSAIKLVAMANKKGLKLKMNDVLKYKTIREILSREMSLGFWANNYQADKPIVVVIHGLTNHVQLKPLTTKLVEMYSVFVVEPLEEHYQYIFQGEDKAEVIHMYTALLALLLPKDSMVHAFIGHSYGGELAYRCAAQWKEMTAQQPQVVLFDTFVGVDKKTIVSPDKLLDESLPAEVAQEIAARMRQSEILSALADGKPLPPYEGDVMLFKALRQEHTIASEAMSFTRLIDENEQQWRTVIPQINVVAVDADHYSMMAEEYVDLYRTYVNYNNEMQHD